MIPNNLIITKNSNQRPICKVTKEELVQKNTFSLIGTVFLMALFIVVLLKSFKLTIRLTKLIKVFKYGHSQLATNDVNKKAKKLNLSIVILIINLINKNGYGI